MAEQVEEVQFEDMGNSSFSKEEITIRSIVLNHIKKILQLSCDEFTGGYYNTLTEFQGSLKYVKKVYVPDTRARFSQAVETLYYVLNPFFDKDFKKEDENIQKMPTKTTEEKLEKAKNLFKELNNLLYRKNYLAD